jgi:hypothetical protein
LTRARSFTAFDLMRGLRMLDRWFGEAGWQNPVLPLVNNTVINNTARVFAIGYDSNTVVENNVITADLVSSDARYGANNDDWPGVLGVWQVDNSTVESNTGGYFGAYVVKNSTISNNYASSDYVHEVERVVIEGNHGACLPSSPFFVHLKLTCSACT